MPRDGSNIYHRPAGTDGVPNFPIESSKYNAYVADVEQDLNLPRPIVAGGSGANNATDALFNVKGEMATQIVTNWDSQVWVPGSFYAASTATGAAPVAGHAFAGQVYIGEALANPPTNQNLIVEARDLDSLVQPGVKYTRQKKAGVWSPWDQASAASDQAGFRQTIYAAPFDALAYNGMQINGSMDVSQERGAVGVGISGAATYVVDRWAVASIGGQVLSGVQTTITPAGYSAALQVTVPTPNTSPAAGHYAFIFQPIEGFRVSRLAWGTVSASPITVAFWIYANRVGTYSGSITGGGTRSYVFTFTINVTNTYEYKTITIPGDTAGTWAKDTTMALQLNIAMMVGTTSQAVAGSWLAGTFLGATGTTNGVAQTSDIMLVTGVVVLPGIEAPSAARSSLIMRPYGDELLKCRRYYWECRGTASAGVPLATGVVFSSTTASVVFNYPVQMRAIPVFLSTGAFTDLQLEVGGAALTVTGLSSATTSINAHRAIFTITGGTPGHAAILEAINANGGFKFDARL